MADNFRRWNPPYPPNRPLPPSPPLGTQKFGPPPYPFMPPRPCPPPPCRNCKNRQMHGMSGMAYGDSIPFYTEDVYENWYPWEALLWDAQDGMARRMNDQIERDRMYFMELYPAQWQLVQQRVEEVIDTLDYSGSPIYDEYPDRMRMYGLIDSIYDQLVKELENTQNPSESQTMMSMWSDKDCLKNAIQILLYQEILYRRMR